MLSRRSFLAGTAAAGATGIAGCHWRSGSPWELLRARQAQTLAALADEIIPGDDYPSASQAGVVTYIDRQLMGPYRRHRSVYESGLERADQISRELCGVPLSQATAPARQQVTSALAERSRDFFELLREHTMEGYYGSPRHGGNRDAISWRMLGLAEPPLRGRAQYKLTRDMGS